MPPGANLVPETDNLFYTEPLDPMTDDKAEVKTARLSRSKAWKEQLEFLQNRKQLYQQYLPGFNPAITKTEDNWRVADCVIKEIDLWINQVENIGDAYKKPKKK